MAHFSTASGLRVGLMICFDINFPEPSLQLAQLGVDAIAFPTAWVDELPFLTGVKSLDLQGTGWGIWLDNCVGLIWSLGLPYFDLFCFGLWIFGRTVFARWQNGNIQIKVNATPGTRAECLPCIINTSPQAPQYHSGWASANKTTLWTSGLHDVRLGSLGSGIYDGEAGIRNYSFSPKRGTRIVFVNGIEECGGEEPREEERLFFKQDLSKYSWRCMNGEGRMVEIREDCGCRFRAEFELEEAADENVCGHVFVALHGTRTFGGTKSPRGIVSCGVVHFERKPGDGTSVQDATVPNKGELPSTSEGTYR